MSKELKPLKGKAKRKAKRANIERVAKKYDITKGQARRGLRKMRRADENYISQDYLSSLKMIKDNTSTPFKMKHQSPLNDGVVSSSGDNEDIDVQQIEAIDLGTISDKEATKNLNTKFQKAKDEWVEGYGGPNNEAYQEEKGGVFYDPVKDKIRTSYLEYPEDADHIGSDKFLGKNWDNK